jgi:hypothetical protein
VRITPSGVHDQRAGVLTHGLGERLGTLLDDDVTPADGAWLRCVERRACRVVAVLERWDDDVGFEARLAGLTLDGAAVDGQIAEVGKELLRAVLALDELEEVGGIIDELQSGFRTNLILS